MIYELLMKKYLKELKGDNLMNIKYMVLWNLAKLAYRQILRNLLYDAVNDPKEEWDDVILEITDRLFDYNNGDV
jgi:hypothetical protein